MSTVIDDKKADDKPVVPKPDDKPVDKPADPPKDEKPADKKVPDPAPVELKLTLGENSLLDPAEVEDVLSHAKANNLTQDAAAALLKSREDVAARLVSRQQQQGQQALATEHAKWTEDLKADKDLGGDKLAATLAVTQQVMNRFPPGLDNFKTLLKETKFETHPEWHRLCSWLGKAMAEDTPPKGTKTEKAEAKPEDRAKRMFPNQA